MPWLCLWLLIAMCCCMEQLANTEAVFSSIVGSDCRTQHITVRLWRHSLFTPWYTLHLLWGNICVGATIPSSLNPTAIVNCERPCDVLIVKVTGISAEYAKPPVNPIKWSELPEVWIKLAICFQDLSTQRSKVPHLHAGPYHWQETIAENYSISIKQSSGSENN